MSKYKKVSLLDDFDLPDITHENIKAQLIKISRVSSVKRKIKDEDLSLEEKLELAEQDVYKALGKYKNFVRIIRDKEELDKYIDKVNKVEILAFDTETNNSLDPLTAKIMGVCFYIPNTRPIYVPVNHCKPGTEELLPNQISEKDLKTALKSLNNVKLIMHNGKFDIRVVFNNLGFYMPLWWDTMLAAQLIDENERAGLKVQFKNNVDPTANVYNIERLFRGIPYAWIDIEIFAIYAAVDAYDTYKLYEVQRKYFEHKSREALYKLFLDIEVPTSMVVAKMEDDGISVDEEFTSRLHNKYTKYLEHYKQELSKIVEPYKNEIEYYQKEGLLENPINYNSFTQLQVLMYDIMKYPILSDEGKTTDEKTLKQHNTDFTKALLEYRHYAKQTSSFTEPIMKFKSEKDGKIHANFHQMGREERSVRTGRFSSTGPNLQQVPTSGTVRLMYKGSDDYYDTILTEELIMKDYEEVKTLRGWKYTFELQPNDIIEITNKSGNKCNLNINNIEKLERHKIKINYSLNNNSLDISNFKIPTRIIYNIIGADYGQQEPRLLTHMCQDERLIETYNTGRDLYAFIGSTIYKRDYWDCMENYQDGTPNVEGKQYRKKAKDIVLGTMYGMGPKLLASNLKISVEECYNILNKFFEMFPTVKKFIEDNEKSAREKGYVEDYLGRRRHLPDIQLPELDIKAYKSILAENLFVEDIPSMVEISDEELTEKWNQLYETSLRTRGKRFEIKNKFKEKAKQAGIEVRDNGAFISKTLTQCTNARIQGGAASLTKKAMVMIFRDDRLNDIGSRLLVPVHDELMAEAPKLHALEAIKYFAEDMIQAGLPECSVAMVVDTYVCKNWNLIEVYNEIKDQFYILTSNKNGNEPLTEEEALKRLIKEYEELSEDTVKQMCYGTYDVINGKL